MTSETSSNVFHLAKVLLGSAVFIIISSTFYSLFISRLRQFPGPILARCSPFWLFKQCRDTRRSEAVMAEHRKHGDYVRIAPNHISINNSAAVDAIYGRKAGCTKSEFYDAFVQVKPNLFNARDLGYHQRKRKYLNAAFSARALSGFEEVMDGEMKKWKGKLLDMTTKGPAQIDIAEWSNYLAFNVIGQFAFGQSLGFIENGHDAHGLINAIDRSGEVFNLLGSMPTWLRPLLQRNFLDPFFSGGASASATLEKIGRMAYQARKERYDSDAEDDTSKDLLSHLFRVRDEQGNPLHEGEIIAESINFLVGGSDTTSSTITNFVDLVSRRPELWSRLQDEVDEMYPGEQDGEWVPKEQVVQKFPLLVATLREVMRYRPTSATGLERAVPGGGKVLAGREVPGGTIVSVPTCGILRDPAIFANPDEFVPERWLEEDISGMLDHFQPFSTGPRACIGRTFAWMEILKCLALLLKLFDVSRCTKEPTVLREGFFNKVEECRCLISARTWKS